ncbi:MAG: sigma-70 family RNA polymerase sigma factor [Phycisphaerae bacterium]|nr:sigma-70 family RNA polymerase sigma factor [Phycisphaerae bacterium]
MTDEELIAQAGQGCHAAFEALYHRYRDWVWSLAWRTTQDQDAAEDVLQETFIYLVKRLPSLTLTARLTTFLYPVVRHLSLEALRTRDRLGASGDVLEELPLACAEQDQTWPEDLASVLSLLPSGQRQVLLMRFVDDMTLAEIALALEIPEGTVKSRLHNALATLHDNPRARRYFVE